MSDSNGEEAPAQEEESETRKLAPKLEQLQKKLKQAADKHNIEMQDAKVSASYFVY